MNATEFIQAMERQHVALDGKTGQDVLALCGLDNIEAIRAWPRIRTRCQYLIDRNANGKHAVHQAASAAYMDGLLLGLTIAAADAGGFLPDPHSTRSDA